MAKDFNMSIGRHSRKRPIGRTSATTDLEKLSLENTALKKEVSDLKDSLRVLADTKNKEIDSLKQEIKKLSASSSTSSSVSKELSDLEVVFKNKELQSVDALKLMKAIREEEILQERKDVKLSRMDFVRRYKVNEAKVTMARDALCRHGFIKVVKDKSSYRYEVIKDLPSF